MPAPQVNNTIYEEYGDRWYTAFDDPVALLRAESRAKLPWVEERIRRHFGEEPEVNILDAGCGGGFLSNALAARGFSVTGVDLAKDSLAVARRHDPTGSVRYVEGSVYELPFENASFDVVTAMDLLEHVEDPARAVAEFARVLKPGGLLFFHTFNRNLLSGLVVIKFVEWFVRNTPKDMHVLRLFVKPAEAARYCAASGLTVREWTGLRPRFLTIPWRSYRTGVVPKSLEFTTTRSLKLSYMGMAERQ